MNRFRGGPGDTAERSCAYVSPKVGSRRKGISVVSTPASDIAAAVRAARAIERWGSGRQWRGPDPYDALNATRLPEIARRSPLALRVVTQAVKRSPWNLRPLLGVADGLSAATLAHVISAYARNGFLDEDEARSKLCECTRRLAALRCSTFVEPCWGYHFDVQTRVFFYPRTTPNTIATAFAGLALLDAHELAAAPDALEMAIGAGEFFLSPRAADRGVARRVLRLSAGRSDSDPQCEHACGRAPGAPWMVHRARISPMSPARPWNTRSLASVADGAWLYGEDAVSRGSTAFTPATCWTRC